MKIIVAVLFLSVQIYAQTDGRILYVRDVLTGAEQTYVYLPLLEGKTVGVVANQTSMIDNTHLVDSLLSLGVNVVKVFSPEHGFRGKADAGEVVKDGIDVKTGLPLVSLYGGNKKPKISDLKGIDIGVFEIQDVGARFYTYISTMSYVMEACAETVTDFLVLDRPNPNGFYVDGPVLEKKNKSFVGLHEIPVVHGMTIAEYAVMVNEEGWLKNGVRCALEYVKCENYSHKDYYQLPVKPSPNLPNMTSIYLYPSLCFFEGTTVSVGRGTEFPFQMYGHPKLPKGEYEFVPLSTSGAKNPKLKGETCNGVNLSEVGTKYMKTVQELHLKWLLDAYDQYPEKDKFFLENNFFNLLAGNIVLRQQVISSTSLEQIKSSWEPRLSDFKTMRKKYILYEDFE
ncbi:MAG: DUF1343 domain-containing protein [Flavobacteriales bacterium]|nr:DUF1343 domain-containing protein [Flavobacteriales bacterium]